MALFLACTEAKPEGSQIDNGDETAAPSGDPSASRRLDCSKLEAPPAGATPTDTLAQPPTPPPAEGGEIVYGEGFQGEPLATKTSPGGVKMEDFVIGTGAEVQAGQPVDVHYTGWTSTGIRFDSSLDRGKPFTFPLGQGRVIKGWDEGLVGMKVGGKRRLTIPPEMGYGERQAGKIPPNSTLIFTVEVMKPLPQPKPESAYAGAPKRTFTTEGGTKVEVFAEGTGPEAKAGDSVSVHYTGKLKDDTVFDSSVPRKQPIDFPLGSGRVIKGWDEGVAGMKVGELRRLTIPADQGYGPQAKGKIPANSELIFTVEMMRVAPGK